MSSAEERGMPAAAATMEMEAYPADRRPPRRRQCRMFDCEEICGTVSLVLLVLLLGGVIPFIVIESYQNARYSVAIDAVSGLDPAAAARGQEPTLDPVFDLTVSISPRSLVRGRECYEPGTTVEVNYHDELIASGPVEQVCARPMKTRQGRVVAWGTGVRLPGFVLDALVADVRRGVESTEFDVTVKIPSVGNGYTPGKLVSCRARRVGDDAAAVLRTPCDQLNSNIVVPLPNTGRTQTGGAG